MVKQLPLKFEFRADRTFDGFFAGNNHEICSHLKKFASGEGEHFIFLWGKSGYGKSHLLHACCHTAFQNGLSSFYLDLTELTVVDPEIFAGLENYEMVCIDNIDRIVGQEDYEMALFNFYNRNHEFNHRLLVSTSSAPDKLTFMLPDLRSRINWGLTLKIQGFDDDCKIAALSFKAQQQGFEMTPQTARYLITHYDRKLSSLWSLLDKLDSASLAAKRKLTIPFLKDIMQQDKQLSD